MALEKDLEGYQSTEQSHSNIAKFQSVANASSGNKSQNDKKVKNYGKPSAQAELTTNTKRQDGRESEGSEDEAEELEKVSTCHFRIINSWLKGKSKHNLDQEEYRSARYKSNYDKQNIIHRGITAIQDADKGIPDEAAKFIKQTVLYKPKLFTDMDRSRKMPMLEAAKFLPDILFMVLDLVIPDNTLDRIKTRYDNSPKCSKDEKCPLWDVDDNRRKQCQNAKTAGNVNHFNPNGEHDTTKASGLPGDELREDVTRCLHGEVDVNKLIDEDKKLKDVLKTTLYSVEHARVCLESLISETNFDAGKKNPQLIRPESFRTMLKLCHKDVFEKAPADKYNLLQQAVRLFDAESLDFELLFNVIQILVEHYPASIFHDARINGAHTTVYKLLKELNKSNKSPNKEWIQRSDAMLREKCIGYRKENDDMWAEKRDLMYWDVKTERQFCLNLEGESVILEDGYIDTIKDHAGIRLESVLAFVKLPYWKPDGAGLHRPKSRLGVPEITADVDASEIKPDPYVSIFEWLKADCGVRKIFTVDVKDDGPEPHTNAAIRRCLRGLNVDVLNWKKFDLCSDTVFVAAPTAREVHLYSRGNTAVLQAWACESGLARLTQLEKLFIEIEPQNLNDEQDCRDLEKHFKKTLEKHCKNLRSANIDYKVHEFGARKKEDGVATNTGNNEVVSKLFDQQQRPKSKEWIEELKEFKDFILNLDLPHRPVVKVAILDDGAKFANLDGEQYGRSFCARNEEYFVGPCEHGTDMALCVREIWPNAELYIARLDFSGDIENQKFTIASCFKALQWARAMDVDIISMSWTYGRNEDTDEDKKKFEDLINKIAVNKKPILFGSLPDIGANFELSQFVPVGMDGVIRISSATISGLPSAENVHMKSDFLLPGEDHEGAKRKGMRGSSFATAYAAGLAALVLYTIKAYAVLTDGVSAEDASKALEIASRREGMKSIFRILAQAPPDDERTGKPGPFVRPALTLRGTFRDDSQGGKEDLRKIVDEMVPNKVKRTYHGADYLSPVTQ